MDEKKENKVVAMNGEGKVVMVEVADPWHEEPNRLLTLDLNDADDWGDVEVGKNEDGEVFAEVGIDEDSRWAIAAAWECVPPTEELHQGKYPMARKITLAELHDLVMERFDAFSN